MSSEISVVIPATVWDGTRFFGLASGAVSVPGLTVSVRAEDLYSLDGRAESDIKPGLLVLSIPAAVGADAYYERLSGFGTYLPKGGGVIAAKEDLALRDLAGKHLALPAAQSTAALVCTTLLPSFGETFIPASDILASIQNGTVEAGVLIHDDAERCEALGLNVLCDLGERFSRYQQGQPLPWSVTCIRRDLDEHTKRGLEQGLRASVEYVDSHREEALAYGMEISGVSSRDLAERLLATYQLVEGDEAGAAFGEGVETLESYLDADYYAANGRF